MKKGFTLIELLVVVLIIGILSAVALPQYEKAVRKSRIAAVKPALTSLVKAQTVYIMANGDFARDLDQLDLQIPLETADWTISMDICMTPPGQRVACPAMAVSKKDPGFAVLYRPADFFMPEVAGKFVCAAMDGPAMEGDLSGQAAEICNKLGKPIAGIYSSERELSN